MFSVVIPAYNCQNTIEQVLDSVRNQSRFDLIEEIIVINDGSQDETEQMICDYMEKWQEMPIQYYSQENHGVSYTRNRGIRLATAEWIALLDSDDVWLEQKIEVQSELIHKHKDMVFLGAAWPLKILFGHKEGLCKLNAGQLCIRSMPQTPSVVFHRETGIELGLFDENMGYSEDINFYQKFLLKDSYYVLAEKLIEVSIGKEYFAQSGLTSNIYQMHLGRNKNTRELCRMKLISKPYMWLMLGMNWLKYFRRKAFVQINRYKAKAQ